MKVSECAELFLSYISDKSPHTLKNYRSDLNQFIKIVGDKEVDSITKADIAKFRMVLQSERKKSSTIARKLACINSFFEYLIDLEVVSSSPITRSHRPKVLQKIPQSLSHEEIRKVLRATRTLTEKVIIVLMLTTGLRSSELLGIRRGDIRIEHKGELYGADAVYKLELEEGDILYIKVVGKGGKEREVPITGEPMALLVEYLKFNNTERVFPLSYYSLWRMVVNIGRRAGIPLHPHKLRHTAATLALQSGAELRIIQELLGHASPLTTARYAKVGRKQLLKATKSLSENIKI
ncbi:MAG: tyrosine-type recombinase/integrase [Aquificae bacterium]|nr:tyrosine-type recombinase/integrase [Aquificota bacterium]